jgi:putative ABC transport system permease protein
LEQFSEKTPLPAFIFIGGALVVIIVILSVVCLSCYRVATGNPVNYLKNE